MNSNTSFHLYGIDNLVEEALAWYDVQKHKPLDDNSLGMIELVKQTTLFPVVHKAILITLTLPATSWYSGKVTQHTVQGEDLVKINDDKVNSQKTELMNRVIDNFGRDPRRLQFLFQE